MASMLISLRKQQNVNCLQRISSKMKGCCWQTNRLTLLCNVQVRLATSRPSLIRYLLISLKRSERTIFERRSREVERERRKSRKVDLFHLQECASERKYWRERHDWHFSLFMCSARDRRESRIWFPSNVYEYCSLTQIILFVYSAVR